jgi:hypothetical protein
MSNWYTTPAPLAPTHKEHTQKSLSPCTMTRPRYLKSCASIFSFSLIFSLKYITYLKGKMDQKASIYAEAPIDSGVLKVKLSKNQRLVKICTILGQHWSEIHK